MALGYREVQKNARTINTNEERWWEALPSLVDFSSSSSSSSAFTPSQSSSSSSYHGPCHTLPGYQGFLYFSRALSPEASLDLAHKCLTSYCEPPHDTNIDNVPPKPGEESVEGAEGGMFRRWMDGNPTKAYRDLAKLSWATTGYNYDWTLRKYHEDKKSPFPPTLSSLGRMFASAAGSPNFTPQASIVNYYTTKSQMGGHRDDLELTFEEPVVSVSCGLPAIFLLGGATKEEAPTPILVRSGDVMVLGGKSRLRYHGCARVIANRADGEPNVPPAAGEAGPGQVQGLEEGKGEERDEARREAEREERDAVIEYLKTHRINVNVRQVLPPGLSAIF